MAQGGERAPRRDRWQRVTVELSIRTSGNHKFAREEAVNALVGIGAIGAHVEHGGYEYEVVRAVLSGSTSSREGGVGLSATDVARASEGSSDPTSEPPPSDPQGADFGSSPHQETDPEEPA